METNTQNKGTSRRAVLRAAGVAGVAATLAAGITRTFAVAAPAPKVRLAWTEVAACHSPLFFGVKHGIYAKHNVDVDLFYQGASGQTLIQALATNKADVGAGLVLDWLKPLEQGFDVQLIVGSHGGCQRLLASQKSDVTTLQGLKGKTIAVADLAGPAKLAFAVTLAKNGFDPDTDVNWQVFPWDLVGEAVHRGDADALAQFDPWAYTYKKDFNLVQLADTQTADYAGRVCCVLGANGPFLKANRDAAQAASVRVRPIRIGSTRSAASPRPISRSTNTPPTIRTKWRSTTSTTSSPISRSTISPRTWVRSSTMTIRSATT